MNIRNNNIIKIRKSEHLIKVYPDGNPHHEAQVPGYSIGIGIKYAGGGTNTCYTPYMTVDDLKELRKVIRKIIKDESH